MSKINIKYASKFCNSLTIQSEYVYNVGVFFFFHKTFMTFSTVAMFTYVVVEDI